MGMLRCNIEEGEESAMARFLGGLNRESAMARLC
jgi:hypothetical protein